MNNGVNESLVNTSTVDAACQASTEFLQFQLWIDYLLMLASFAATLFGVVIVYCAVKLYRKSEDTIHLFIISMTCGDILLTVFCHPQEFAFRSKPVSIQFRMVMHFCYYWGLAAMGLSLTMLNIDKVILFGQPFRYDRTLSRRKAIVFCALIWIFSFSFVSYGWLSGSIRINNENIDVHDFYYIIFMSAFCILPVSSSMIFSIWLYEFTRSKQHFPFNTEFRQNRTNTKNKVKSILFIFVTTAWISFSLLPYRILNLLKLYVFNQSQYDCGVLVALHWTSWLLLYILALNPIIDPWITGFVYAPYRSIIKKLFCNFSAGNDYQASRRNDNQTDTASCTLGRQDHRQSAAITEQEMTTISKIPDIVAKSHMIEDEENNITALHLYKKNMIVPPNKQKRHKKVKAHQTRARSTNILRHTMTRHQEHSVLLIPSERNHDDVTGPILLL